MRKIGGIGFSATMVISTRRLERTCGRDGPADRRRLAGLISPAGEYPSRDFAMAYDEVIGGAGRAGRRKASSAQKGAGRTRLMVAMRFHVSFDGIRPTVCSRLVEQIFFRQPTGAENFQHPLNGQAGRGVEDVFSAAPRRGGEVLHASRAVFSSVFIFNVFALTATASLSVGSFMNV